jgi:hypothetical protein
MAIVVDVVNNSGLDWAAVAAAGATAVAAVGGIWGTARQARRGREAATEDLRKSLAAAQENLRLNITAEDERVRIVEESRSYDAAQQRITELYSKAVEQLGHEKAPVRLGGFYALERLAQDNVEQRQTVVDVVCAYLRMPFSSDAHAGTPTSDSENYQELQVRLAAQSLLVRHLQVPMVPSREKGIAWSQPKKPPSSYWENLKINLASAHLFDMDFTLCVIAEVNFGNACFTGEITFGRTRFEEICSFDGAKFYGAASFRFAVFNAEALFDNADFRQEADFYQAWFGAHGSFDEARFRGGAIFDQAEFRMGAFFRKAQFDAVAQFHEVQFGGPNWFDAAQFTGSEPDFSGSTVRKPNRDQHWPPQWQTEPPIEKDNFPQLVRRTG